MRWELDTDAGALYITLREQPVSRQEEMPDGVVVDVDDQGRAVGIEILSVWAPFDWRAIIRRFNFNENDAESLEFLVLTLITRINKQSRSSPLQADSSPTAPFPTRTSAEFAAA
jgi:uncharacterized protein YuzE